MERPKKKLENEEVRRRCSRSESSNGENENCSLILQSEQENQESQIELFLNKEFSSAIEDLGFIANKMRAASDYEQVKTQETQRIFFTRMSINCS